MGYASHEGTSAVVGGNLGDFSPKGSGFAPSIRLAVDVLSCSFGSFQLTGGYRLGNSVSLEVSHNNSKFNADSNLKHQAQLQIGGHLRIDYFKKYEFGIGFEARNDWMKASGNTGYVKSEASLWRPWMRINARYMFEKEGSTFVPYVGLDCGFALEKPEIHSYNYFLDYVNNTGDKRLDPGFNNTMNSPDSYTRAHAPNWEVSIVVGIRFGRNCP
jgi:hypothetical protein